MDLVKEKKIWLLIIAVAIIFVSWPLSQVLEEQSFLKSFEQENKALRDKIESEIITNTHSITDKLAKQTNIQELLINDNDLLRDKIHTELETIKYIHDASIIYVMNKEGKVVATTLAGKSNVDILGNNYAYRTYFIDALKGKTSLFPAVGITTKVRGLYFARPIKTASGEIIGVVIVKMGVEKIDEILHSKSYPAMLLTKRGVVFVTNKVEWLFKSTRQLNASEKQKITSSKQYAGAPLDFIGFNITDKKLKTSEGQQKLSFSYKIGDSQWGLAILRDRVPINYLRWLGMAFFLCILFLLITLLGYYFNENKRVRKRIVEERDRAQSYLNLAGVLFVALDRQGNILLANPKCCEVLETTKDNIIGKNWFKHFIPDKDRNTLQSVFKDMLNTQEVTAEYYQNDIITASGNTKTIAWHNTFIKDENGVVTGVLSSGEDISETKHLREQMQQSEKLQSIGKLAGGIAHDFNNQLTALMGYAHILKTSAKEDSKQKKYAEKIIHTVEVSATLTNQLLAFARKGQYKIEPIDLHDCVDNVIDLLQRTINKSISIKKNLNCDLRIIEADNSQIENAILNIAINARDAMPHGGEIVFRTSKFHAGSEFCRDKNYEIVVGDYIKIEISDTGTGMSKDVIKRIFEPFYTTKAQGKGTGMGLAAVYGTIKNHNGIIEVDSEVDIGTTFKIYLPLARHELQKPLPKKDEKPIEGNGLIMVVDDEDAIREISSEILSSLNYQVETFADGKSAIEYYKKNYDQVDLILLDMIMPELNGYETFLELKKIDNQVKAIIVSGYSVEEHAQSLLDQGAIAFIQKPFRVADFARSIDQAMRA